MWAIGKKHHSEPYELSGHRSALSPSSVPQSCESVGPEAGARCASLALQAGLAQPGTPPRPAKRARSQPEPENNPSVSTLVAGSVPEPVAVNTPSHRWEDLPGDIWTKIMEHLEPLGYRGPLVESCRAVYNIWSAVDSSFQKIKMRRTSYSYVCCCARDKNGQLCCPNGKRFVDFIQCDWAQRRLIYVDNICIGGPTVQRSDMGIILRTVAGGAANLQHLTVSADAQISANSLAEIGVLSGLPRLKDLVVIFYTETQLNDKFLHQLGKLTRLEQFSTIDGSPGSTQHGSKYADWTPEGLNSLTRLRRLRMLDLDRPSRLPGALSVLANMTGLEIIFIRGWPGLAESVLRATLQPLQNLSKLICQVEREGQWFLTRFDYSTVKISKEGLPQGDIWTCGVRY